MESLNSNESKANGIVTSMNESEKKTTLGDYLKTAREKKSLSIDAISRHTKISATNLDALEKNEVHTLPNIAYVKGFVKSYSKIVDVDLDMALELLNDLYGINKTTVAPISVEDSPKEMIDAKITSVINEERAPKNTVNYALMAVGALLVIGFAVIGLKDSTNSHPEKEEAVTTTQQIDESQANQANQENEEVQASQNTESTENADVATQSISEESPLAAKEETKQEVAVTSEVKKEEIKAPEIKVPELKKTEVAPIAVEAKKIEAKTPEVKKVETKLAETKKEEIKKDEVKTPDDKKFYDFTFPIFTVSPDSNKMQSLIPDGYRNSIIKDKQNVFIIATDGDTWITYKADSDPVKKFVLKQNRYIMIRGEDLRIFLGNVNVTKIFLNNSLLDFNSPSGVKSLVFPQDLARSLKLPLFIYQKDGSAITSEEYINNLSSTTN